MIRFPTQAVQLSALDITVTQRARWLELQGFYDRRDRGGISGHFLDRDLIERRRPTVITDLLHELPGVRVLHIEPGRLTVMFSRTINLGPRNGCEPALHIDGTRYQSPGSGFEVDNFNPISVAQLEAVEVYVGAATPIQYQHPCGVVLFWTRRGGS